MNAPAWLPVILAAAMLAVAGFILWRIAMAAVLRLATDLAHDAVILLLSLATAGMLVRWMHLLNPGGWAVLLGAVGAGLLMRAVLAGRSEARRPGAGSARTSLAAASGCAIAVYMLLAGVAPSTLNGSTAGGYTMAGMPDMIEDTTITFPAIGMVFAVILLGYAVAVLDRLSPLRLSGETEPGGASATGVFAPRMLALCEVVIVVTMAYSIFAKLV